MVMDGEGRDGEEVGGRWAEALWLRESESLPCAREGEDLLPPHVTHRASRMRSPVLAFCSSLGI